MIFQTKQVCFHLLGQFDATAKWGYATVANWKLSKVALNFWLCHFLRSSRKEICLGSDPFYSLPWLFFSGQFVWNIRSSRSQSNAAAAVRFLKKKGFLYRGATKRHKYVNYYKYFFNVCQPFLMSEQRVFWRGGGESKINMPFSPTTPFGQVGPQNCKFTAAAGSAVGAFLARILQPKPKIEPWVVDRIDNFERRKVFWKIRPSKTVRFITLKVSPL